jgi:hypothetical protein
VLAVGRFVITPGLERDGWLDAGSELEIDKGGWQLDSKPGLGAVYGRTIERRQFRSRCAQSEFRTNCTLNGSAGRTLEKSMTARRNQ